MEYATRAGSVTSRYFGETDELLSKYAWHSKNAEETKWPVGSRKPSDLGLFDVHGNSWTWCQESFKAYPQGKETSADMEDELIIASTVTRVMRGGSFTSPALLVRTACRVYNVPTNHNRSVGFRAARTFTS
jgi:eukaryotic-like serine/threonine-protein kinase